MWAAVTGPLRGLVAILRRLTAGDHAARAQVTGPAEMREVARSLNALADESDRLRAHEAETSKLRAMARETGLRVREHLRVEDLLREAKDAIESSFGADVAYLHLKRDEVLGLPVGHEDDWLFPGSFLAVLRSEGDALFRDLFQRNASLVYQNIPGADGDRLPPRVRDPLRAAGIVAEVIVPFGAGAEMLGIIAAARRSRGRPWTEAEVSAIELVAADVGRGLHHDPFDCRPCHLPVPAFHVHVHCMYIQGPRQDGASRDQSVVRLSTHTTSHDPSPVSLRDRDVFQTKPFPPRTSTR